jgi:hypothetical protein
MPFIKCLKLLLFVSFVLLFVENLSAEYYRYVNDSGAICFTDDLGKVPEYERLRIKAYSGGSVGDNEILNREKEKQEKAAAALVKQRTGNRKIFTRQLEEEKKKLADEFEKLMKKRNTLQKIKNNFTDRDAILDFNIRMKLLNDEISAYQEKRNRFNNKADAYNKEMGILKK